MPRRAATPTESADGSTPSDDTEAGGSSVDGTEAGGSSVDGTSVDGTEADRTQEPPARERILVAAEELFAEHGFDATPTSRIAAHAGVPKGLVHYYFRRKTELLAALVERLPDEHVEAERVVVRGDIAESLRRLVAELDRRLAGSRVLSHLLWREADTHRAVAAALQDRYDTLVTQVRAVILAAAGAGTLAAADVDSAAGLLALAVSYRHATARHAGGPNDEMDRELTFLAGALTPR